ncbi:MAG: N-acetylneuraminate synthase [Clostridiaceae bacterium]|nr:N-acetylneuraminate synthase [Clostridiaceae bacterium]
MDKILMIAEAGVNHNGSLENARKLVRIASEAGADAVKFQIFKPEKLLTKYAQKAEYQKAGTGKDGNQLDMLKKLALSDREFLKLKAYCDEKKIMFLATPFDFESIDFLASMDMPIYKIPSGEITDLPHLIKIARLKKPVILSTGMCGTEEIRSAVNVLALNGVKDLTLLHCNTQYPTPFSDVNLQAMLTMKKEFQLRVGYSDHTLGTEVPIAAAALGADVIEKHFTISRDMQGPDHKASLEPLELKEMITSIRHIEAALGDGQKRVTESERCNLEIVRKSIVAKQAIYAGETLTEKNITVKRPGNGISPMRWFEVLGSRAIRNFAIDELIEL